MTRWWSVSNARRERLLKSAFGEKPRPLGQPNDRLSSERLRMERRNAGREEQAQSQGEPNNRRDDAEADGGAANALPSATGSVDEDGSSVLHGERTKIANGPGLGLGI